MACPEGMRRAEKVLMNHRNYFAAMQRHMATLDAWFAQTADDLENQGPGVGYDKMPEFPEKVGCNAIAVCWNALMALRGLMPQGCPVVPG